MYLFSKSYALKIIFYNCNMNFVLKYTVSNKAQSTQNVFQNLL